MMLVSFLIYVYLGMLFMAYCIEEKPRVISELFKNHIYDTMLEETLISRSLVGFLVLILWPIGAVYVVIDL